MAHLQVLLGVWLSKITLQFQKLTLAQRLYSFLVSHNTWSKEAVSVLFCTAHFAFKMDPSGLKMEFVHLAISYMHLISVMIGKNNDSLFCFQEKIFKLYERKLHGDFDTNSHIQKKKEFRNPRSGDKKCL